MSQLSSTRLLSPTCGASCKTLTCITTFTPAPMLGGKKILLRFRRQSKRCSTSLPSRRTRCLCAGERWPCGPRREARRPTKKWPPTDACGCKSTSYSLLAMERVQRGESLAPARVACGIATVDAARQSNIDLDLYLFFIYLNESNRSLWTTAQQFMCSSTDLLQFQPEPPALIWWACLLMAPTEGPGSEHTRHSYFRRALAEASAATTSKFTLHKRYITSPTCMQSYGHRCMYVSERQLNIP